jgi:hypothetical protein
MVERASQRRVDPTDDATGHQVQGGEGGDTVCTHGRLEVRNFCKRRILSAGSQEVPEARSGHTAIAFAIEQCEGVTILFS